MQFVCSIVVTSCALHGFLPQSTDGELQDSAAAGAGVVATSDSAHSAEQSLTVKTQRWADAALLVKELYPEIRCKELPEADSLILTGEDAIAAKSLVERLKQLTNQKHQWSLITVPGDNPSAELTALELRKLMPELFIHVGTAKNLILAGGPQEQLELAAEALHKTNKPPVKAKKRSWTVFSLKHLSAIEANRMLVQLVPEARFVLHESANALLVSADAAVVDEVEQFLRVLDTEPRQVRTTNAKARSATASALGALAEVQSARNAAVAEATRRARSGGDQAALRKAVREDFEARQEVQFAEIALLKRKLELLEGRLRTYRRFKEQMIENRVSRLLDGQSTASPPPKPLENDRTKRADGQHKVQPGDTLGFYIPHVLGEPSVAPPVHTDPTGARPPTSGYPFTVRSDGSLSFPLIGSLKIAGLTLGGVEARLKHELTEKRDILKKGQATVVVSLIREAGAADPLLSQPTKMGSHPAANTWDGKVRPGDTLGVYIQGVLGGPDDQPPIHTDPTGVRPPVMGFPMEVRHDGTISLPLVGKHKVNGFTLAEIESRMLDHFVQRGILTKDNAVILVSLMRQAPRDKPLSDGRAEVPVH